MNKSLKAIVTSGRWQLNAIGIGMLCLLGFSAWALTHPLTMTALLPLALIAYACWRIVFELTWNRKNVPTLATSSKGRTRIVQILEKDAARHGAGYSVIDLGSGRGELARRIATSLPGAEVMGIELARIPHLQSLWLQKLIGPKNLTFKSLDFWHYDCSTPDAVLLYLNQRLSVKVGEKLKKELKAGSTVISHTFPLLGDWSPTEVVEFRTPFKETIYVYRKPDQNSFLK